MSIACLAGGVGAARFLTGLAGILPDKNLTVIVNTGDDERFYGLHVSPDIDIVCYTLAGIVDEQKGWGVKDDTFGCLEMFGRLGLPTWFQIGDRDFATHLHRTFLLDQGHSLTEATDEIRSRLGLKMNILPMTDGSVRTRIKTHEGTLSFQEYFVKMSFQPQVTGVEFAGVEVAEPTQQVLSTLEKCDGIIICPSNPIISIGPILSLRGLRNMLCHRRTRTVVISPIVGGLALRGPADRMMKSLGYESTALGVAQLYQDVAGTIIIDEQDRRDAPRIGELGMKCIVTNTVMNTLDAKAKLAETTVKCLELPD